MNNPAVSIVSGDDLGTCLGMPVDMVHLITRGRMTVTAKYVGLPTWSAYNVLLLTDGNSNADFSLIGLTFPGTGTRTVDVSKFVHDLRFV